jgi:hypothetical protein
MRFSTARTALVLGIVHLVALVWLFNHPGRRRMMFFDTVSVSRAALDLAPASLGTFGYTQDDVREMLRFREAAEAVTAGATTDLQRIQQASDATYRLRREGAAPIGVFATPALSDVAAALGAGGSGQCGHLTWMLVANARSLGIDTRQIVWANDDGTVGHASLEFYSRDEERWIYFDLNLNGYAEAGGRALSAADLRSRTEEGAAVTLVSNLALRNWSETEFTTAYERHEFDWYLMTNALQVYEPGRRFGRLHAAHGLFMLLPFQARRVADLALTGRPIRLALDGHGALAGGLAAWTLNAVLLYLTVAPSMLGGWLVVTAFRSRTPIALTPRLERA